MTTLWLQRFCIYDLNSRPNKVVVLDDGFTAQYWAPRQRNPLPLLTTTHDSRFRRFARPYRMKDFHLQSFADLFRPLGVLLSFPQNKESQIQDLTLDFAFLLSSNQSKVLTGKFKNPLTTFKRATLVTLGVLLSLLQYSGV